MDLINAEKQASWRGAPSEKRKTGTKLRAQLILDGSTGPQLKRIACHKGCSVTPVVKE
jgi:peptidyl-tRNA hydrolase